MRKKRQILKIIGLLVVVFILGACNWKGASNDTSKDVALSAERKLEVVSQATQLLEQKGEVDEMLELYKLLIKFEPANSILRQKALRYILDGDVALINEGKAEEGLKYALELDKLIPGDYYIQNRILAAYKAMAEAAIAKKDWVAAYDLLYNKALSLRFDAEVMRVYFKLRYLMAKEAIEDGRKEEAKQYLQEVVAIGLIEDNKPFYEIEVKQAEELLGSII